MLELCDGNTVTFASYSGFLAMARDAEDNKRNRSVYVEKLEPCLVEEGKNVLKAKMLHNGVEWRTWWMVAVKHGTPESVEMGDFSMLELCIDVDFDTYTLCTETITLKPGLGETEHE